MSFKKDLILLFRPYYLFNILLSLSYIICKRTPGICNVLFIQTDCELDGRETEILFFLLIVIMIRTRKAGSVTMINYLTSSFMYTKVANLILWFYADFRMGLIFGIIFIFTGLLLPEPTYSGPEKVVYFRGAQGLIEELERDKTTKWVIEFYTVWNPQCVNFAPVFSKLSNDYSLDNLRFGKVDVGRYPDAGQKYHVNDGALSKQLPTVILFEDCKESCRRPNADSKGKLQKFLFSEDAVKAAFDLNNLYTSCKEIVKATSKKGHIKKE